VATARGAATRHSNTHWSEGQARLNTSVFNEYLSQHLMHMFCLEIFSWNILHCFHSHIQNLTCRFFQLLTSILLRLNIFFGRQQAAHHARYFAQQAHAWLYQLNGISQNLTLTVTQCIPRISGHNAILEQIRYRAAQEIRRLEHADVFSVNSNRFIQIKMRRISLHIAHIEVVNHFVQSKDVSISRN